MSFRVHQIGIAMGVLCCILTGCAQSQEPAPQAKPVQTSEQQDKQTLLQLVRLEQLKWQDLGTQQWQAQSPGRTWTARLDQQARMHMEDRQKRWSLHVQLVGIDRRDTATGMAFNAPTLVPQDDHIVIQHQGITQWYGHHAAGLRHGMEIQARPDGQGDLLISLDVQGGAVEQMGPDHIGVTTKTGHRLSYQGLRVWDAQQRPVPAQLLAYANNQIQLQIDDAHAQYPLTIDPDWLETPDALTMDFARTSALFGDAIAVDGNVMVVGAPNSNEGANVGVGLVYVYEFDSNNGWQMVAQLRNPRPSSGDFFGQAVAVDGINDFIAVSAPGEDDYALQAGIVYVFERVDGHWVNASTEVFSVDTDANDLFGTSIAMDAGRLVIGAPNEDTTGNNTGAVYVFEHDGMGNWNEVQRLSGFGINDDDQLGHSVAIDGDFIIAGAPFADGGKGLAKIYQHDSQAWLEGEPPLQPVDLSGGDQFGRSVAIDQTAGLAMVGAPEAVSNGPGTVYAYEEMGGMWINETSIQADTPITGEQFGSSLSFDSDQLAIGAASTTSGGAYLFDHTGANQWSQSQRMAPAMLNTGDRFGKSIFFDGVQIFIGAPERNDAAPGGGAFYIFESPAGTWTEVESFVQSDISDSIELGHAITILGDDAAVGAPNFLTNAGNVGAVFIFHKNANNQWVFSQKLLADTTSDGAQFGFSVAMGLDHLAVGSPGYDGTFTDSGAVYIFERQFASGVWTHDGSVLTPSTQYAGEKFGHSVEMDGNYMIAGAPGFNGNEGRAILFREAASWTQDTVFGPNTGTTEFGFDVSINGSFIAVGAPKSTNGTVYLYDNTANVLVWLPNVDTPEIQGEVAGDLFGYAVDLQDDVMVIGAPVHKPGTHVSGAAYVYHRVNGVWGSMQKLFESTNSADNDRFGDAVDTDGYQLVVGAPLHKANDEGSAFIYKRDSTNMWSLNNSVNASSGANGHFGQSVAIEGIYTMVGAPGFRSVKYMDEGRAHAFKRANTQPVMQAPAAITATVGQPIAINVTTTDPDGDPLFYNVMGSNGVVTGTHPNLFFEAQIGPMAAIFVDAFDGFETTSWVIPVNVNEPPNATGKTVTTNEDAIVSDKMDAFDFDGNPLTFTVNTAPINGMVNIDNMTGDFTYTPNPDFFGTDSFTFSVNDGLVDSNIATITINIDPVDDPPQAMNDSATLNEDTSTTIFLMGLDIEGDTLEFIPDISPVNGVVNIDQNTGKADYTPNANYHGSDSFTFTIMANGLLSNVATVNLTINPVNDLPQVSDFSVTTDEDTSVAITLTGTDVDADPLQYQIITQPANGTVANNNNGAFDYVPNPNFSGTDSLAYIANDGTGNSTSAIVTITVNPINDIPTPMAVSVTTDEDTQVSGTLVAQDPEGDMITFALLNMPSKGNVTLVDPNTGQFTYTPNANENGTDTFTFTASDASGTSMPATVTIDIQAVDDPPTAQPVSVSGLEDTSISGVLNGADIDSATLTYVKKSDPTNGVLMSFNVNTGAFVYQGNPNFHGTDSFQYEVVADGKKSQATVSITVTPVNDAPVGSMRMENGTEDNPVTGSIPMIDPDGDALTYALDMSASNGIVTIDTNAETFTYTPNQDFFGTDTFSIKATDGTLSSTSMAEITINVAPVNDRPVAADLNVMGVKNMTLNGTMMATDVEGDALTFVIEQMPQNGQVTLVDAAAGTFRYSPNANYSGQDTFTFVVDDGQNLMNKSLPATVTINIANTNAPPIAQDLTESVDEDTALGASLSGNDPDGNPLTYTIVTQPTNGTLSGLDVNTGDFTYTPSQDFFGTDTFTFTVNDGIVDSMPATATITITPVNDAPVRGTNNVLSGGVAGQPIMVALTATDVDNDVNTLTARALAMPANGTVTFNGLNMVYTANSDFSGQEIIEVVFSDGIADSEPTRVTFDITPRTPDMVVVTEPAEDMVLEASPATISIEGGAPNETLRVLIVDRFGEPVFETLEAQEVVTDAQGNATYTLPAPLPLDNYTVTILRGEDEVAQSAFSISVPGVTSPTPVGDVIVENGVIIQPEGEVLVIEGEAPAGSTVVIKDQDGKTIAETIANDQGRWVVKLPAKLGTGILDFIVEITTPDGKKATVRLRIRASDWSPLPFDRDRCQHTPGQPPSAMWLFGCCMVFGLLTYRRRRRRA